MYWLYLGAAIALEIAGTISMKFSQGFTRLTPSILMVVFYLLAFTALNFSLKQIEVSVAYAIWSGLGTAVIAVIGYLYFNESMSLLKAGSIILIILGVIGLNLGGGAHGSAADAQSESTLASEQQAQE
ncbi:DMT family transporter [Paenibacillus elgii]